MRGLLATILSIRTPKSWRREAGTTQVADTTQAMNPNVFLLLNLALSFYLVGAIWAHEIDTFRTWRLIDPKDFRKVQTVHWHKLPYWIFTPIGLGLAGSIVLIWYHTARSPVWAMWGNLGCQVVSHVLTAILWGPWQAKLAKDDRGPASPYLAKILRTHWIRTLLINAYGFLLLAWCIQALA